MPKANHPNGHSLIKASVMCTTTFHITVEQVISQSVKASITYSSYPYLRQTSQFHPYSSKRKPMEIPHRQSRVESNRKIKQDTQSCKFSVCIE